MLPTGLPANSQATPRNNPRFFAQALQQLRRATGGRGCLLPVKKPPSLRNNNGTLQVRVRIDGRDVFINRLGRWDDPVAVANVHAIAAQI